MEQKKIAVVLPLYKKDSPIWFHESIDSLLTQTYSNIKVFIGVDGPIDEELELAIGKYEGNDKIQIVKFAENRGLACVLNDLLDICFEKGYEYIARMDADDISLPDRFEKQLAFMEVHPEIDVVGGAIIRVDENNIGDKVSPRPLTPEACRKWFARATPMAHPAVMFRKSFFDKAGCKYRPEYRTNQDTLLWFDGLKKNVQMANLEDVVLRFRMSKDLMKTRRAGYPRAKKQLVDRLMINKELGYSWKDNLYAYCVFLSMISPAWVRSLAYILFKK